MPVSHARLLAAALVAGASVLLASTTVTAEAGVRWGKCGTPTRIPGKGVACANGLTYNFNAGGAAEVWVAKFTTPMNQCAPLRLSLELDGVAFRKKTGAIAAGKSETVVLGDALTPGAHVLVVKSEVLFSECFPESPPLNPGSWGVDAQIFTQPK